MDATVLIVFALVYSGMILGGIPGLALDRTGVALLGAIAFLALGLVTLPEAVGSIDVSTMALLLGLMVVSAQLRLGGFYTRVILIVGRGSLSPGALLAAVIGVSGLLSALLANDVVCLAVTPVLAQVCVRRRLDPVPFLLALACAANVGSAATLIGNPQNMLIGQRLGLSFAGYLPYGVVPALAGLGLVWLVIFLLYRGKWEANIAIPDVELPDFNTWQTAKGLAVLGGLVAVFLFEPIPRELAALAAAGILFTSRHMASRKFLALVDWPLLVLFAGLFVVNHVLDTSGILGTLMSGLAERGLDIGHPAWLFGTSVVLSNLVSNVPAVMLLLPMADHPDAGPILALASTLAGNLVIVGSIANIIVIEQASRLGIRIGWRCHARVGIPLTLLTLAVAAGWLWLMS
jgi:Na+/H+ antiporter NhaD/arsenite permease-like protein